jgi:hypothetical protein
LSFFNPFLPTISIETKLERSESGFDDISQFVIVSLSSDEQNPLLMKIEDGIVLSLAANWNLELRLPSNFVAALPAHQIM